MFLMFTFLNLLMSILFIIKIKVDFEKSCPDKKLLLFKKIDGLKTVLDQT